MVLGPLVENEAGILGNKRTEEESGGKKKEKNAFENDQKIQAKK